MWIGIIVILIFMALIVPEIYVIAALFLYMILEFILRLFGLSFDKDKSDKEEDNE